MTVDTPELKILFLDIGGVLLNNAWGHESRQKAADRFGIKYSEMEVLHNFIFSTYETGKIALDEYLDPRSIITKLTCPV